MTLGWLNVLLRHMWPTLLEKEISEAVSRQIRVRYPSAFDIDSHHKRSL